MKFTHLTLSALALGLGLSFTTLTSCKDNDLSDSGNNNGSNTEQIDEKAAQKYNTLECLLSALGNVDTLPDNWNSTDYRVDPTIGVAQSEAAPYSVRLVATTNADEANREFRSMISAPLGGAAKDTTWTQEGVGTLSFKVAQNDPSLYATLTCNLQQMPKLQEIRFVPASVIGNNAGNAEEDEPFYQFGDIIMQTIGDVKTYWVCVRPASKKSEDLGRSHWCTFQLVPKDTKNSNYKTINEDNYLPTDLCANRSDGIRMTQNFFNVLRIMAKPSTLSESTNLDKVVVKDDKKPENVKFSQTDAENISFVWNFETFWDKVFNKNFNKGEFNNYTNSYSEFDLKDYLSEKDAEVNAFFYGYSSILFGSGNYRVYNMNLKAPKENGLFTNAKETTPWLLKSEVHDFSVFENEGSSENFKLEGDNNHKFDHQFIVKHRTGAQLDNSWFRNDKDCTKSFTIRSANGIEDVFVSKQWFKKTAKEEEHGFFVPGDRVLDGKGTFSVCIKGALENYDGLSDEDNESAFFLCQSTKDSPKEEFIVENLSDKMARIILFHLFCAYKYDSGDNEFVPNKFLNDTKRPSDYLAMKDILKYLQVNINDEAEIKKEGDHEILKVNLATRNATTCYKIDYDKTSKTFAFSKEAETINQKPITVLSYLDSKAYIETFTKSVYKANENQKLERILIAKDVKTRGSIGYDMFYSYASAKW